jgi:hypothetical protein
MAQSVRRRGIGFGAGIAAALGLVCALAASGCARDGGPHPEPPGIMQGGSAGRGEAGATAGSGGGAPEPGRDGGLGHGGEGAGHAGTGAGGNGDTDCPGAGSDARIPDARPADAGACDDEDAGALR